MSGIETQKCIKPVFSDKSDKSKSFVQIYDLKTGTFVIKIYNFFSEKFFKFAFKNVFDEPPLRFHIIYHKIMVPDEDEDGGYFLELEQIYVCFIYKARFFVILFGYNFHLNIIEMKSSETFQFKFNTEQISIEKNGDFRIC